MVTKFAPITLNKLKPKAKNHFLRINYFTLAELGFTESGKELPIPDKVTIENLEKMPFAWSRRAVVENFRRKFAEWSKDPKENLPIAVLPESDAKLIGAKARVAVVSPETFKKQQDHHPELVMGDYLKVQEAVDKGEILQQGKNKLNYILKRPDNTVVIIKSTQSGDEMFMVSLWRMSQRDNRQRRTISKLRKK